MWFPARANPWWEAALNLFYPPVCQLCAAERATASDGYVCTSCFQRVRFVKPPFCERCGLPFEGAIRSAFTCANCEGVELHFTAARSAVVAREVVLEAIHRYKYNRALWFEPFLAGLLITAAGAELRTGHWTALVPVPLHPLKEREREFNQSLRLARRLGRATGLPVATNWLRRVEATRTQTLLSRAERAANVRRAFAVPPGAPLRGARVVLVDDVFTTGATTNACAAALRGAGAAAVCVWTVARGV
ncbi:MAG: ComF family protein [Candidatus Brachytrichaceae bacterium NZ_4S206]|jgi:ComF family protein